VLLMERKQAAQQWAKCWAKAIGGSWGRCCTSKQYLAGFWSYSDSELSQEINAQNGTCHCGLQKFGCKQLALKLDGFRNETPRGDWLSICPPKQGARWIGIGHAGNNTQCCPSVNLLFVNSSVRKMGPAFAEKCMAVAVACIESSAEPVRVRQHFSFPNSSNGKCTCVLCCRKSCETYTCHGPDFGTRKNQSRKEDNFWNGCCCSFCCSSSC
jgi:hypothetical protein